jgi:hypothetical protein
MLALMVSQFSTRPVECRAPNSVNTERAARDPGQQNRLDGPE